VLDPASNLYYQSQFAADGTQWVTWFDAYHGTYQQYSYPPAQAVANQSFPGQVFAAPEGFDFDPASSRFIRLELDISNMLWTVWFDAVNGVYTEDCCRME
jgi:hypothetical protein